MASARVQQHRWDEIALEKVTEMISRKVITGEREMLAQIWLWFLSWISLSSIFRD